MIPHWRCELADARLFHVEHATFACSTWNLFSDTETREDTSKEIVRGKFAADGIQMALCKLELLGNQLGGAANLIGAPQVAQRAFQRLQMALAGEKCVLPGTAPPGRS